jgi:hypothetical protein
MSDAVGRRGARQRVVGFIGNCQAELLHKVFRTIAPFGEFRTFYHFFQVPEQARESCVAELAACDDLLVQGIEDVEDYPLYGAIRPSTTVHPFPFLRFASPWPYDDFNGLRDTGARAQDDPELHTTTYYDGILGRLRRQVLEPEARLKAYRTLEVKGAVDPARVHDFETRRLENLDRRFGCRIGRRILDDFRETRLFYTVNRPSGALLVMVMARILAELRLDMKPPPEEALDELRSIQVPVHPLVARRLGMKWADETTRYGDSAPITWEGFVRGYIARYG